LPLKYRLGLFLLITASAVLVFYAWPIVIHREGASDSATFYQDVRDIYQRIADQYIVPLNQASLSLSADCATVAPGSEASGCEKVVIALRDGDKTLAEAEQQLQPLLSDPPADVPEANIQSLTILSTVLADVRRANQLLIRGWTSRNDELWKAGWDLHDSISLGNLAQTVSPR
jgi:hypothetical protein